MLTRREFLESCSALGLAPAAFSLVGNTHADVSTEAPEYQALVCIALAGGADSFNMLVPTDDACYRQYANRRGELALHHDDLLPLDQGDSEGRSYALHKGLPELQAMYAEGQLAWLANVGPLAEPNGHSRQFRSPELSHSGLIARWHRGTANRRSNSGWAGRAADIFALGGRWKGDSANISLSGKNLMQVGEHTAAIDVRSGWFRAGQDRDQDISATVDFSYLNEQLALAAVDSGRPATRARRARLMKEGEAESRHLIDNVMAEVPEFSTPFSSDPFSASLQKTAQLIGSRHQHGARRQIFFIQFDGWDHHHSLLRNQTIMLPRLSRGLAAFRDALVELKMIDVVTTFTVSEFGRSLEPNSSKGSDHGWGGNQLLMGGALRGGRVYGRYPDLVNGNPIDIGGGCFAPTTTMDEYLAEMLLWLGLPLSELAYVLPDLWKYQTVSRQSPPLGMFV